MTIRNRFRSLVPVIICYLCPGLFSQTSLIHYSSSTLFTQQVDTTILLSDKSLKSPWGAVIRSAILPGWGQIYNEQYAKSVIAFATNGLIVYQIYRYEQRWRDTKNEADRSKRNLFTWYFSLAYILTMVDSYVDAYLFKFDEAMKISYQIIPQKRNWICSIDISLCLP